MAGTMERVRRQRCESGGGVSLLTQVYASWLWVLLQTDYPGPMGPSGGTDVAAGPHQPLLPRPLTQPGTPRVCMAPSPWPRGGSRQRLLLVPWLCSHVELSQESHHAC